MNRRVRACERRRREWTRRERHDEGRSDCLTSEAKAARGFVTM